MRLAALCLLLIGISGCATPRPSPFKDLGDLSETRVAQILAKRTDVKSFYAVLALAYDGPDREGTFDAVMHYMQPGFYRFTAFKDLIVSTADVFDLVLTPRTYAVRYTPEGADEPKVFRGHTDRFAEDHPRFRGFAWAGEALFLPGSLAGPPRVEQHYDATDISGRLATGAGVRWEADNDTLEVYGAIVSPPSGERLKLRYSDYVRSKGRYFPGRVECWDPAGKTRIVATPVEYEVNPKLDAAVFELDE